jgi:exopolysaccharide biosynthesis polyprenyl glycosylphosphotransferase
LWRCVIASPPIQPLEARNGRAGRLHATAPRSAVRPPHSAVPRSFSERVSGITVLLVVADVLATCGAGLFFGLTPLATIALLGVLVACRSSARVYRRRLHLSYMDDFPRSVASTAAAFGLSVAIFLYFNATGPKDADVLYVVLVFIAVSEFSRMLVFAACGLARRRLGRGDRALVLGADPVGVDLVRKMAAHPEFGLRPIGMVDLLDRPVPPGEPVTLLRGNLADLIVEHRIGTVVLANYAATPQQAMQTVIVANRLGCSILLLPRLHELFHDAPDVERLHGYPLVRLARDPTRRISWWVKRGADIAFATLALVALAPVIACCALAVLIESGRPLIFVQDRVGLNERPIRIYKFRSMRPADEREAQTRWNIAGDPRVGPVGRLLRRTSLDELPQLWNIVRGDMSIVGPRPERPGFVAQFSAAHEAYWARHRVPSGLTGLAQVNGLRGDTSIADRARYDNYYVANWSLWLDAKIVLRTLRELVRRGDH